MKHLSDQELMRIVQAGDFSPASEIYDRYSGRIYNFALRFLRNAEAAEDATQEVFVKMMRHANQFQGDAKLSTWLFSLGVFTLLYVGFVVQRYALSYLREQLEAAAGDAGMGHA